MAGLMALLAGSGCVSSGERDSRGSNGGDRDGGATSTDTNRPGYDDKPDARPATKLDMGGIVDAPPDAPPDASADAARAADTMTAKADGSVEAGGKPPVGAGDKRPVVASPGCAVAGQLTAGEGTLPNGRKFAVHLPTGYDGKKPFPLVFANHSNGASISQFNKAPTINAFKEWAILVRTASQTGDWREAHEQDLAYFDMLVPHLNDKLCVDSNRIHSFGFSGGGSFSSLLACKRNFLRGFGSSGGIPGGRYNYSAADCKKPMPAWVSAGDRTTMEPLWKARNGCTGQTQGTPAMCKIYTCTGAPMVYCGPNPHTWPPFTGADESVASFLRAL